ncbi:nitrogen fixation protein NifU [Candidatus Omnitrophus magneticus]|uniref:Nitrogen fixation protein NifU n=1 Tax=Candidatus Omnitrophus magneticus TaxID=1609969 RepID=A0A0F0CRI1_9BACT|nr:nitrogen fixation protein NifU [Candidatus Omnitrophus magneticus]
MDWVYSDKLKEHFMNPKNILYNEKEFEYDGKGKVGNIKCGDEMIFYIKVDKARNIITDCRWKTYGCASAIASTSILSEKVIGMTLDAAYKISPENIMDDLGGLPEHKIHCSVLGDKALRAAINDYYERNGMHEKTRKETTKIICQCMNVTDEEIEHAVLEGVRTYEALQEHTKLGTVCGQCKDSAVILLEEYKKKYIKF